MSTSAGTGLGVGIVGLSATRGWASTAHVPAIAAVDGVELRGLVASTPERARAAADKYGVGGTFDTVEQLAASEGVDLVVVSLKTQNHRDQILPALAAGADVLCEWPLGKDLAEAEELVAAAAGKRTFVGLQGRTSPGVRYLRDLVADGFVGRVLSSTVVGAGGIWGPTVNDAMLYALDVANGATLLTIPTAHVLDSFSLVLGTFTELSATTATLHDQVLNTDTGGYVPMSAEDQVAVTGRLQGGAVAAVHFRGGMSRATNMSWEINGTEGDLLVTAPYGSLNAAGLVISGARGADSLVPMPVPPSYDQYPGLAGTPAHAVAHLYAQLLVDRASGSTEVADFAQAAALHRVLDAIQRSAATGERQLLV